MAKLRLILIIFHYYQYVKHSFGKPQKSIQEIDQCRIELQAAIMPELLE